jgi:hypothetical protein
LLDFARFSDLLIVELIGRRERGGSRKERGARRGMRGREKDRSAGFLQLPRNKEVRKKERGRGREGERDREREKEKIDR